MPIFKEIISEQTQILIWKYSEEEEFSADLISDEKEFENLKQKSPKRLIEKQMVRQMLKKSYLIIKSDTMKMGSHTWSHLISSCRSAILFLMRFWRFLKKK